MTFNFVVYKADQARRLHVAGVALVVFIVIGLLANLNGTGLHGVYRDQLGELWLPEPEKQLAELDTCSKGAPLHLFQATVNWMGRRDDPDLEGMSRFSMSHKHCGTRKIAYRDTGEYFGGKVTVAQAMAISGAAVTAVNSGSLLFRVLVVLTNFRLGQWLRNPTAYKAAYYWPCPLSTLYDMLCRPEHRRYLFVSDGGHLDNTGLAALLERKCKVIFLADASYDPHCRFHALFCVLHAARAKYGIRIQSVCSLQDAAVGGSDNPAAEPPDSASHAANMAAFRPNKRGQSKAHVLMVQIAYKPDGSGDTQEAVIFVAKATVTGDEAPEVCAKAMDPDSEYPNDKTTDQFLPPDLFEAYAALGFHVGEEINRLLRDQRVVDPRWLPEGYFNQSQRDDDQDDNGEPSEAAAAAQEADVAAAEPTDGPAADAATDDLAATADQLLQDRDFDETAVRNAADLLRQAVAAAARDPGRLDDCLSTTRLIRNWSVEYGEKSAQTTRRKFCGTLLKLVDKSAGTIIQHPEMKADFVSMLSLVGGRFEGVREAIRKLQQEPDAADAPS